MQFSALTAPAYVGVFVGLAAAVSFAAAYTWLSRSTGIVLWLAGVVVTSLVALAYIRSARQLSPGAGHDWRPAVRRYIAVLFLMAAAWGVASPLLLPAAGQPGYLLVIWVLLAVAGAGALVVAAARLAILAWVAPIVAPLAVLLLLEDWTASNYIGVRTVVVAAAIVILAHYLNALLLRSWLTEQKYDSLVRVLRDQMSLVERANLEKSRFLRAASHDLRQPMHALGLFAAALDRNLEGSPLRPAVTNMVKAVDALDKSFNAMLDISKLDAGVIEANLQTFPIRDVFRRLHMHCAAQAEELGLSLRFKAGGKIVTSDPQLLERVLSNLIHNAMRYTHSGGIVVVARTRSSHLSLEVWDTGIGIPAQELPKIFDEFYQVSNPGRDRTRGLGMGLAIVKRLVLLMGHELEVSSAPGRGTVFRVLLIPTELADMQSVVLGADTVPAPEDANQTALIIDDEESIRIGMSELLQTWGYVVLVAGSIADACAAVRRHAGVIHIVVSDLRLSDQEDGIDAIARVREAYGAPMPAILITGDTSAEEVKRAHDSGHRVLFKPVQTRELYTVLRGIQ